MISTQFKYVVAIAMGGFLLGCSATLKDEAAKNKKIVRQAFEVVGNGLFDEMDRYIATDYVRHCQATPQLDIRSLDDFKEFIRQDRITMPDQQLEISKLVAEGDLVAFFAIYKGTQTGPSGPFPASNKYVELDFAGMHRIEDGKIAETWLTWDNMSYLSQLGHLQMGD